MYKHARMRASFVEAKTRGLLSMELIMSFGDDYQNRVKNVIFSV